MRRARVLGWMAAVVVGAALAGCTAGRSTPDSGGAANTPVGDIPDNQAYVVYAPTQAGYMIKVPEGWASTVEVDTVSFTDKLNTIVLRSTANTAAPTVASGTTDLESIGANASGFAAGPVSTVTRTAGEAVLVSYRIDAAPDPVTGKIVNDDVERYEFFHAGLLVTVTLSGPHGADNTVPWRTVTDSLSWVVR
jgi:hypothetical protein